MAVGNRVAPYLDLTESDESPALQGVRYVPGHASIAPGRRPCPRTCPLFQKIEEGRLPGSQARRLGLGLYYIYGKLLPGSPPGRRQLIAARQDPLPDHLRYYRPGLFLPQL